MNQEKCAGSHLVGVNQDIVAIHAVSYHRVLYPLTIFPNFARVINMRSGLLALASATKAVIDRHTQAHLGTGHRLVGTYESTSQA
jgi:hypothetical protein